MFKPASHESDTLEKDLEDKHGWRRQGKSENGVATYGHKRLKRHQVKIDHYQGTWSHSHEGKVKGEGGGRDYNKLKDYLHKLSISQHTEEPVVEPGHVTPERAAELVNNTPNGWIRR